MLEGPQTDGVTIGDKGECVITPSTDLKFDPGLKGKSKLNYLRNYWLLIGESAPRAPATACCPLVAKRRHYQSRPSALCSETVHVGFSDRRLFYPQGKQNRLAVLPSQFSEII